MNLIRKFLSAYFAYFHQYFDFYTYGVLAIKQNFKYILDKNVNFNFIKKINKAITGQGNLVDELNGTEMELQE